MGIIVKLYGTLGRHVPGYDPTEGISIKPVRHLTVEKLVTDLGISKSRIGIVTINGVMAQKNDPVPESCTIKIFQPLAGG